MEVTRTFLRASEMTPAQRFLTAYSQLERDDTRFDIPFDQVLEFLQLGSEPTAIRTLKANYERDLDFTSLRMESTGGRPREVYMLNSSCFESFCLSSRSPIGKEVRSFYKHALRKSCAMSRLERLSEERIFALMIGIDAGIMTPQQVCSHIENKILDSLSIKRKRELMCNLPELVKQTSRELKQETGKETP